MIIRHDEQDVWFLGHKARETEKSKTEKKERAHGRKRGKET
jgi:hypothetical protein